MTDRSFFVGTSGWSYNEWQPAFYPHGLARNKWLAFYAQHFLTIEVNSTFYRLPSHTAVETWFNETPQDFVFSLKMSQFITHVKQLQVDTQTIDELNRFFNIVGLLQEKLQVIVVQLPARLECDDTRLYIFLETLKKCMQKVHTQTKVAIEFRHKSWFTGVIMTLLKRFNVAFVCASGPDTMATQQVVTADFMYLRFHGRPQIYRSLYSASDLKPWAAFVQQANIATFAYFNNTMQGHALTDAKLFAQLLTSKVQ